MDAVGMLEVFGFACAMVAADAGCKAGNVYIEAIDKNKPANAESLLAMTGIYSKHIIAKPDEGTEGMLKLSCIGTPVPPGQAPTKDRF